MGFIDQGIKWGVSHADDVAGQVFKHGDEAGDVAKHGKKADDVADAGKAGKGRKGPSTGTVAKGGVAATGIGVATAAHEGVQDLFKAVKKGVEGAIPDSSIGKWAMGGVAALGAYKLIDHKISGPDKPELGAMPQPMMVPMAMQPQMQPMMAQPVGMQAIGVQPQMQPMVAQPMPVMQPAVEAPDNDIPGIPGI